MSVNRGAIHGFRRYDRRSVWGGDGKYFRKVLWYIFSVVIMLAVFFGLYLLEQRALPVIFACGENQAMTMVNHAISDSVAETFEQDARRGKLELLQPQSDKNGRIYAVSTDTYRMNMLSSELTGRITRKLEQSNTASRYVSIPAGTLLCCNMFRGMGPDIPVRVIPQECVSAVLRSEYTTGASGETVRRIYVQVECRMRIVAPWASSEKVIHTEIPLEETIFIGAD